MYSLVSIHCIPLTTTVLDFDQKVALTSGPSKNCDVRFILITIIILMTLKSYEVTEEISNLTNKFFFSRNFS